MADTTRYLGLLVPSADPVVEQDFHAYLPDGVGAYVARMSQGKDPKCSIEGIQRIRDAAEQAAESLAEVRPELVVFCGTSASFMHGVGTDHELSTNISVAAGGIPAINTTEAVVEGLKAFGANRIFMLTPYPEDYNVRGVRFFTDSGFEMAGYTTFNCQKSMDIPAVRPEQIVEKMREHGDIVRSSDAVFMSCTALRALPIIEPLEKELGVPIVFANQATIWASLRHLGVDTSEVHHAGQLFQTAA
jgi:maleate isomerase